MITPADIHRHIDEALDPRDPYEERVALVALRRLVDEDLPWLERRVIRRARATGYTWARIGRLLQRPRQTVRQRYASIDDSHEPVRVEPLGLQEARFAEVAQLRADARRRIEYDRLDPGDAVPW